MSSKIYGDLVVGIPYGDGTKKRWQKIGVVLRHDRNDATRGPGLTILLDRHFNPAGVPAGDPMESSVGLSVYWPKDQDGVSHPGPALPFGKGAFPLPEERGQPPAKDDMDDDIPF
jgi:hypothetical protein